MIYLFNEGVHANDPLKLRSYWTDVGLHEINIHYSKIITLKIDKNFRFGQLRSFGVE